MFCNPNLPLFEKSQMLVYLNIYVVWGEGNSAGMFLRVVDDIWVLVSDSYVMGKCWSGMFVSVR